MAEKVNNHIPLLSCFYRPLGERFLIYPALLYTDTVLNPSYCPPLYFFYLLFQVRKPSLASVLWSHVYQGLKVAQFFSILHSLYFLKCSSSTNPYCSIYLLDCDWTVSWCLQNINYHRAKISFLRENSFFRTHRWVSELELLSPHVSPHYQH